MSDVTADNRRLVSLDVFRGLTIAGMIIVNDPGDWGYVYAPLRHAVWDGITPTDLVFPFFLFIVGVSIVLAYTKRLGRGDTPSSMHGKIARRAALIFLLGLLLALFPGFDFANIRLPGVLQRIAIVFFVCSIMFLHTSWRTQAIIGAVLLLGYCLMMGLVPVPIDTVIADALATGEVMTAHGNTAVTGLRKVGGSAIAANFQPGVNLEAWLDRKLVPGRLYEKIWDPEGLLSTLPSIGTGILGMMVGHVVARDTVREKQSYLLLLGGFFAMLMGVVWDWFFPFNKNLWSSSFVMYTGGLASMSLGALIWMIDIRGYTKWIAIPQIFGANAIAAYVIHGTLGDFLRMPFGADELSIQSRFMSTVTDLGLDRTFVSLVWALLYTALVFLPVWWMYRKKIFLRV